MTTGSQTQLFPSPPPQTAPASNSTAKPATPEVIAVDRPQQNLSIPDLLEQVFRSQCEFRRWERELLFGATDEELGHAFGNAWCSGYSDYQLHFQTQSEPALRISHRIFNVEVATLTAPEVAAYVRRFAGIPEAKSDAERAFLLATFLDQERKRQRAEILPYVRSRVGEKTPRHKKNQAALPSTSEAITALLFENDCLTDRSDCRLLIAITRLLIKERDLRTLKAAEIALSIVDSARGRWRSMLSYWTDVNALSDDDVHHYIPGPATAPP